MEFLWPRMLWSLLLIPVLVVIYVHLEQRRRKQALTFDRLSFVKQAIDRGPGLRRHLSPLLYLLGVAALAIGSARPALKAVKPAFEGTVILAIDTSGSMVADDVRPNRMQAAKAAAMAFVANHPPDVKIGIVAFSDDAALVQAPTTDQSAITAAIDRLTPQRGTAIGQALQVSLEAIMELQRIGFLSLNEVDQLARPFATPTPLPRQAPTNGLIILLTDGVNNQSPQPSSVAAQLAERKIRVYTIGLGSPKGSTVVIDGQTIQLGLDEPTLDDIARTTGGAYYNALNEVDLKTIYSNLRYQLVYRTETIEITAALAGAAFLFVLIGMALGLFWFHRYP